MGRPLLDSFLEVKSTWRRELTNREVSPLWQQIPDLSRALGPFDWSPMSVWSGGLLFA